MPKRLWVITTIPTGKIILFYLLFNYYFNRFREKRRREPKFKDRKEKLIFRHKNHNAERKQHISESDSVGEKEASKNPANFYIPLPTSNTTCSAWCENKARFRWVLIRHCRHETPKILLFKWRGGPQRSAQRSLTGFHSEFGVSARLHRRRLLLRTKCQPVQAVQGRLQTDHVRGTVQTHRSRSDRFEALRNSGQ